jgi:hypothetical protein
MPKLKLTKFRCGKCGRQLPENRYVYSRFTGERYCYEGECKKVRKAR